MGDDSLLFKNKYRIPSARMKGWDYSTPGWCFITICTRDKRCLFGEVIHNGVRLNHIGEIVREEWENSFQIRKELVCDTYIIMPDHIHGFRLPPNALMKFVKRPARPYGNRGFMIELSAMKRDFLKYNDILKKIRCDGG